MAIRNKIVGGGERIYSGIGQSAKTAASPLKKIQVFLNLENVDGHKLFSASLNYFTE